ncbi:MAG TPA: DUF2147 domain-containing protein [Acetobacteraceae bacterium]
MRVLLIPAVLCGALALSGAASAQGAGSPVGLWRTMDDKTGKETGAVRIFESGGALYGRIERITDPARAGLSCIKCSDDRKNKPLIGLDIMRGLKRDGDAWDGGTILDPETGGTYKSSVRLDDGGQKLVVRGYLGVSLLGRSQTWIRAQ